MNEIKKSKIAICGSTGWVGKSMLKLFPDACQYTTKIGSQQEVNKCDVAFICIPTPMIKNHTIEYKNDLKGTTISNEGKLDTSMIEDIMKWISCPLIVMRSTVNPGDCDKWQIKYSKKIVFIPEYLGETPNHPLLDPKSHNFLIIGGEPDYRQEVIDLLMSVYNANTKIRETTLLEAEVIKLTENRAIAFKVMQMHELHDVCVKAGLNYNTIRMAVYNDDPRFNLWFTAIYEQKGFNNSKCLKKDVPAWVAFAESVGYDPKLTRALVTRSNEYQTYGE